MRTADTRRKLENGWKEKSRLYEIKAKQGYEPFGWKRAEFAQANCSICVLSMMHMSISRKDRSRGRKDMPRRAIRANRGNRSTFSTEGKLVRMEKMEDEDWQVGQVGSVGGRRMMMGRICAMSNDIRKRI